MKHQVLSPTVQHGEEANLGAEMFWVGGNGAQGFRSGPKENVVHHFLVLISDGGNLFRESKDDMEILGVEELGLTILDPLGPCQGLAFWAMAVAAGVVGNALVLALIALFQVAAEGGGPTQFDGTHDAALGRGKRSCMLFTIGFAITTKHVSDFQPGTLHGLALKGLRSRRWGVDGNRTREQIKRAGGGAHLGGGNAQIAGGGSQAAMAEQELNSTDVGTLFEEVNGKCVP
jgi:hypothetical protein